MNRHVLPSAGESPGNSFTRLWDEASIAPVSLPTLHIGGWFDIFCPSTLSQYAMQLEHSKAGAAPAPRLIVGPWTHTNFSGGYPDVSFGLNAAGGMMNGLGDLSGLQTAWFDAVLKGEPGAAPQRAAGPAVLHGRKPVARFSMSCLARRHRSGSSAWTGRCRTTPGSGGSVGYYYDPLDPVPTGGRRHHDPRAHSRGPGRPACRRGPRRRPDLYGRAVRGAASPSSATVSATFFAASTAVDTDFVVRLCRVTPDGTSLGIADGIVRASWRDSHAAHRAVTSPATRPPRSNPAGRMNTPVSLWQTAYTFAPGERLRVQVTSSCHPRWDRNLNTGKLAYDSAEAVVAGQSILFGADYPSRLTAGIL